MRPKVLTTVAQDSDGVTATFTDGDTIRARYVVGADGMHSTVREQAGITFRGGPYAQSFVLADVHLTGDAPTDEVILFWDTAGLPSSHRCPTAPSASLRRSTMRRRNPRSSTSNACSTSAASATAVSSSPT